MNLTKILSIKQNFSKKSDYCYPCKYYERTFVPSYITNSNVLIIGEAPGKTEAEKGIPFIGESGQLLRKVLTEVGFEVDKISFANICHCHPPSNETPDKKAQEICYKYFLSQEVANFDAKVIILAGATALNGFFPKEKITTRAGNILQKDGRTFFPIFHPSYCLRNPESVSKLRKDLKKAYNYVYNKKDVNKNYLVVTDEKKFEEAKEILKGSKIISFDVETNGTLEISDKKMDLWTIGFSNKEHTGVCFPINHPDIQNIKLRDNCYNFCKGLLESNIDKIAHNCIFDIQVLKKFDIDVKGTLNDTMILAYLLDENRYSVGLKQLTAEYLDKYENEWSRVLLELGIYNCEDADNTIQLYKLFFSKVEKEGMLELYTTILMPMCRLISQMETTGVGIDKKYSEKLLQLLEDDIRKIYEEIHIECPISVKYNLSSPKQVGDLLFNVLKYPVPGKKSVNGYSTDIEVLTKLSDSGYVVASHLINLRKTEKLISTYVKKLPEAADSNSRIHCSFKIVGTRTGRMASAEPNLQNIPTDKRVKKMFIAREGYSLLNVDASQMELRVACSIADEKNMIEAYNSGIDIHRLTASKVLNKSIKEVTKDDRQKAKGINFGFIYGASAEGFQMYAKNEYGLELSLNDSISFRKKFFEAYPGFLKWYDIVRENIKKYGYIQYLTGRRRRFPEAKGLSIMSEDIFRKGVNSPVQGSSSDIILYSMVRLNDIFKRLKLDSIFVLTVHDSFVMECRKGNEIDVCLEVNNFCKYDIPIKFPWLKVPMVFDFHIGDNWGEQNEFKKFV